MQEKILLFFSEKGIFLFKGNVFKTKEEIKENQVVLWILLRGNQKKLLEIKDTNKSSELLEKIKNRWSNLKDNIEEMSKEEIESEKTNRILEIITKIVDFNKEVQKQQGSGLKILTPDQMLSRLSITLPQLNAGNNSEKLKNEITQLFYSLYRSKKLTK